MTEQGQGQGQGQGQYAVLIYSDYRKENEIKVVALAPTFEVAREFAEKYTCQGELSPDEEPEPIPMLVNGDPDIQWTEYATVQDALYNKVANTRIKELGTGNLWYGYVAIVKVPSVL